MNAQDVMKMIQENEVRFVDLRFTDIRGKEHHVGLPVSAFEEEHFEHGHPFDGSSLAGWKGIQASDMILMPEPATAYIDPEDDGELQAVPPGPLPERAEILAQMRELLGPGAPEPKRVQLHYLGQRIEVEIVLPARLDDDSLAALRIRRRAWLESHPRYRNIRVFSELAL